MTERKRVGLFASLTTRSTAAGAGGQGPYERLRGLPARFEAVGETLATGEPVEGACGVVGRDLARDGVDLEEALAGLRSTYVLVAGRDPDYRATRALCVAWSEETLGYLHQVSCENPMTGLASPAHLRARLLEVQRGAERDGGTASASYAMVVVDLADADARAPGSRDPDHFARALGLARAAERIRTVFGGEETIGQVSPLRLLVLAGRDADLATRVVQVRELLEPGTRVWIEGLPGSSAGIAAQLSELARARGPL